MRKLSESEVQERRREIIDAIQCGGYAAAAKKLCISQQRLQDLITKFGVRQEASELNRKYKKMMDDAVISMASDGLSIPEIANSLNLANSHVRYILHKNSVGRITHARGGKSNYNGRWDLRSKMMSDLYGKYTYDDIAEVFGYSVSYVYHLIKCYKREVEE